MATFTVVILGDTAVGKSVYLNRLINGDFEQRYISTFGTEKKTLTLQSNYGNITFEILDTAGQEKFNDKAMYNVQGSILMFDLSSTSNPENVKNYLSRLGNGTELVLVGNKSDITLNFSQKIVRRMMQDLNCPYYSISAKSNYNFDKPFLHLARKLSGHADLSFQ